MIVSSALNSFTATLPITLSQSIGETPFPGLLVVRFFCVNRSPFFIGRGWAYHLQVPLTVYVRDTHESA